MCIRDSISGEQAQEALIVLAGELPFEFFKARVELLVRDAQRDGAGGNVDLDLVVVLHNGQGAAQRRFRADVADAQAAGAAGEAAVCDNGAGIVQRLSLIHISF